MCRLPVQAVDAPVRFSFVPGFVTQENAHKRMPMKKPVVLCLLSAALSGCMTQSFHMNPSAANVFPDGEISQHFFLFGSAQGKAVDVATVCGGSDKLARVETSVSVKDALLSLLASPVYSPRTIRVYCVW